ncbi:hypothetical protein WDW89_09545 [Deltaproteobacteria bacterium TL4]
MIERRNPENLLLRRQCEEIENYIMQFPKAERERRMLEWIENYACSYRENMETIMSFVERNLKHQQKKRKSSIKG